MSKDRTILPASWDINDQELKEAGYVYDEEVGAFIKDIKRDNNNQQGE